MPTPRRQHPTIAAKTVGEWDDDTRIQEFLRIQDDYECAGLRPTRQAVAEDTVRAWSQASLISNYLSLRQDYESALEASFGTHGARGGTAREGHTRHGSPTSRDKKRRRTRKRPPHQLLDEAMVEGVPVAAETSCVREDLLKTQKALSEVQLEMVNLKGQSEKWEREAQEARMGISQLIEWHQTEAISSTTTIQEQNATIASLEVQVDTQAIELEEKKKHCSELDHIQNALKETLLMAESLRAELAESQSVTALAEEAKMQLARDNERLRGESSTSTRRCKEKDQLTDSLRAQLVSRDKQIADKTQLCFDLQQMLWQQDFRGSDADGVWLPAQISG